MRPWEGPRKDISLEVLDLPVRLLIGNITYIIQGLNIR